MASAPFAAGLFGQEKTELQKLKEKLELTEKYLAVAQNNLREMGVNKSIYKTEGWVSRRARRKRERLQKKREEEQVRQDRMQAAQARARENLKAMGTKVTPSPTQSEFELREKLAQEAYERKIEVYRDRIRRSEAQLLIAAAVGYQHRETNLTTRKGHLVERADPGALRKFRAFENRRTSSLSTTEAQARNIKNLINKEREDRRRGRSLSPEPVAESVTSTDSSASDSDSNYHGGYSGGRGGTRGRGRGTSRGRGARGGRGGPTRGRGRGRGGGMATASGKLAQLEGDVSLSYLYDEEDDTLSDSASDHDFTPPSASVIDSDFGSESDFSEEDYNEETKNIAMSMKALAMSAEKNGDITSWVSELPNVKLPPKKEILANIKQSPAETAKAKGWDPDGDSHGPLAAQPNRPRRPNSGVFKTKRWLFSRGAGKRPRIRQQKLKQPKASMPTGWLTSQTAEKDYPTLDRVLSPRNVKDDVWNPTLEELSQRKLPEGEQPALPLGPLTTLCLMEGQAVRDSTYNAGESLLAPLELPVNPDNDAVKKFPGQSAQKLPLQGPDGRKASTKTMNPTKHKFPVSAVGYQYPTLIMVQKERPSTTKSDNSGNISAKVSHPPMPVAQYQYPITSPVTSTFGTATLQNPPPTMNNTFNTGFNFTAPTTPFGKSGAPPSVPNFPGMGHAATGSKLGPGNAPLTPLSTHSSSQPIFGNTGGSGSVKPTNNMGLSGFSKKPSMQFDAATFGGIGALSSAKPTYNPKFFQPTTKPQASPSSSTQQQEAVNNWLSQHNSPKNPTQGQNNGYSNNSIHNWAQKQNAPKPGDAKSKSNKTSKSNKNSDHTSGLDHGDPYAFGSSPGSGLTGPPSQTPSDDLLAGLGYPGADQNLGDGNALLTLPHGKPSKKKKPSGSVNKALAYAAALISDGSDDEEGVVAHFNGTEPLGKKGKNKRPSPLTGLGYPTSGSKKAKVDPLATPGDLESDTPWEYSDVNGSERENNQKKYRHANSLKQLTPTTPKSIKTGNPVDGDEELDLQMVSNPRLLRDYHHARAEVRRLRAAQTSGNPRASAEYRIAQLWLDRLKSELKSVIKEQRVAHDEVSASSLSVPGPAAFDAAKEFSESRGTPDIFAAAASGVGRAPSPFAVPHIPVMADKERAKTVRFQLNGAPNETVREEARRAVHRYELSNGRRGSYGPFR